MGLRIFFSNAPEVREGLSKAKREILDGVRDLIATQSETSLERIKELTPVDTGLTKEKWHLFSVNRKGRSGKAQGAFFAVIGHPYNRAGATRVVTDASGKKRRQLVNDGADWSLLEALEFGTRAHTITPKEAGGFLRFSIDGQHVRTKKVSHPGTRAYNMTTIAAAEAARDLSRGLEDLLKKAIATVDGIG